MQGLMADRGSSHVTFNDLSQFNPPPATQSYYPVAHTELASRIKTFSQDIIRDYAMVGEDYVIARQGNQIFGHLRFEAEDSKIGISVAWRNSYDKSMSIGFVVGGQVFVCSNMMMSGDISVMKKHTPGAENTLTDTLITTLHKAKYTYAGLIEDAEKMRSINMDNDKAAQMTGILFFNGIISPRQLPVVRSEWLKPAHDEFEARNLFSFYNACTESLKTSPPNKIMENHIELHRTVMNGREVYCVE